MKRIEKTAAVLAAFALVGMLGGCAPRANDESQQAADEDAASAMQVDFIWSETSECGMCHATEQASFDDAACAASQHTTTACVECHADTATLATAHEGATADQAARASLRATTVEASTCESCHDRAEVAAATVDATALTDENGTVVNPHALPESADHADIACTNCHALHTAGVSIEKKAQRACASCHHANVYECYTCHS